ncbi:MAG: hypothetical protein J6A25_05885 [Lachnospiraceae bacterium]|nr:hypothetical protein [Lachnospiraceae bacterium]
MKLQFKITDLPDSERFRTIKIISEFFRMPLKKARDLVYSGDFVLESNDNALKDLIASLPKEVKISSVDESLSATFDSMIQEHNESDTFVKFIESIKTCVFVHTPYVIITKQKFSNLLDNRDQLSEMYKYRALYEDLKGSLESLNKQFENAIKENSSIS